MNTLQKFEAKQLAKYQDGKSIPDFAPGDTIKVNVRIKEGSRERVQAFEGVCIGRAGKDINATFTVRKISYGEGVERVFPLWSSRIDSVELIRRGSVRRAKLYYLRDRSGKSARIAERTTGAGIEQKDESLNEISKTERRKQKQAEKKARREDMKKQEAERKAAEAKAAKEAAEAEAKAAEEAAKAEEGSAE
ncbi:MAG: 50S ribosomal protein L19 [Alphaproteobacteria bacterium]